MTATARTARRRRPWIALVVVLAVVAALVVAAEVAARAIVPGIVRSIVIEQLDLPADQQLDVEVSGILLPQLIAGRLDQLHLASGKVTLGGVTGSADVTATDVPVSGGELGSASGTVSIDQAQLQALLAGSELPIDEIALDEPNVTVTGSVDVLGRAVPVGLTATPGADAGELLLTPVSASLAGNEIDLQRLGSLLGAAGARLTDTQRLCIADRLPAGITLTGLRVDGERAVIDIAADGRIAVDPALLENGTCSG
ncbi:LmeA family phospholipid-binding protein [Microbacterium sp.]|uniref:LmeA family phospholipid-binding protein n=1 Tax=Microbacterium sp. TaxID=51671 RepID=UPI0028125D66|nr:DUF2993 domain-containing protein [Microbacterium sp.]